MDLNLKLSEHFSESEFLRSETAERLKIKNYWEKPEYRDNAKYLCSVYLEPIRALLGKGIVIKSGYRCKELNALLDISAANSDHLKGLAVDIVPSSGKTRDLYNLIRKATDEGKLPKYDQLYYHHTKDFVHLGIGKHPEMRMMHWIA